MGRFLCREAKAVEGISNVVLAHGGFADGSGRQDVYDLLKDGYNVAVVQNPTTPLADDVAVTKRTPAAQTAQHLLGHSYGGAAIRKRTMKGGGPRYIAAFLRTRASPRRRQDPPPGAPAPPLLPPRDGSPPLDWTEFRSSFAAGCECCAAAFMADSQAPWGLDALNGAVSEPAWKTKPSWYLVSTKTG